MDNFWQTLKTIGLEFVQNEGLALIRTIAFLVLGLVVIKVVQTIARSATLKSNKLDSSATTFIISVITVILYVALIIVLVTSLGFSTAGIIAGFSAVALAIALALKDSLASLANGVIIIFTKPFKKGDYVKIGEYDGLVQDIRLFNTKILTYNNEEVIVPNSDVLSQEMINYSAMPLRRVCLNVPVSYGTDIDRVKALIMQCAKEYRYVVSTPGPSISLTGYDNGALNFSVKVWTPTENYWDTLFDLYESIYKALRNDGIDISYNKMDIRLLNESEAGKQGKPDNETLRGGGR